MTGTEIQWATKVWNVMRGCRRVSPGCGKGVGEGGCYAEKQAYRFSGPGQPYEGLVKLGKHGPQWTGRGRVVVDKLDEPLRMRAPRDGSRHRIFVNSMSDLFFEEFSNEEIAAVFGVMAAAPQHDFLILTKRATRMREWFEWVQKKTSGYWHGEHGMLWVALQSVAPEIATEQRWKSMYEAAHSTEPATKLGDVGAAFRWPLPNVWLGVSVEDVPRATRVIDLLATPAAVRFVSYEPALELVHFDAVNLPGGGLFNALTGLGVRPSPLTGIPIEVNGPALDWVIVGGESGRAARTFDLDWARNVRDQCARAAVACFIKQLGARPYGGDPAFGGTGPLTLKDGHGGDWDEWEEGLRVREFPGENRP